MLKGEQGVNLPKISGIITTYNEERHIEECIRSIAWCDEILIVDSYSTDNTLSLAKQFENVRVLQRPYYGSASQKNWAMDQANHDWMFILDADERCSPELRAEMEEVLLNPAFSAYKMVRETYFLGQRIRYSGFKNDTVTRLLKRGAGRCPNKRSHGAILAYGEAKMLNNRLIHYMVNDLKGYFKSLKTQSKWGAAQFYVDNRPINLLTILTHAVWRFLRTFFFQLGFLDGPKGLVFCFGQAYGTFMKYGMCWKWRWDKKLKNSEPVLPEFDMELTDWYVEKINPNVPPEIR